MRVSGEEIARVMREGIASMRPLFLKVPSTDIEWVADWAMLKCLQKYEGRNGAALSTMYHTCLHNELVNFVESRWNRHIVLSEGLLLMEPTNGDYAPDRLAQRKDIEKEVEMLPARGKEVVERIYGLGGYLPQPFRQISADLGVSIGTITNIHRRSLESLKRQLAA